MQANLFRIWLLGLSSIIGMKMLVISILRVFWLGMEL